MRRRSAPPIFFDPPIRCFRRPVSPCLPWRRPGRTGAAGRLQARRRTVQGHRPDRRPVRPGLPPARCRWPRAHAGRLQGPGPDGLFGFTQCPDVCPTALTRALEIRQLLGPDGQRLAVAFITIDPERDTPEVLKAYVGAFDPALSRCAVTRRRRPRSPGNSRSSTRRCPRVRPTPWTTRPSPMSSIPRAGCAWRSAMSRTHRTARPTCGRSCRLHDGSALSQVAGATGLCAAAPPWPRQRPFLRR